MGTNHVVDPSRPQRQTELRRNEPLAGAHRLDPAVRLHKAQAVDGWVFEQALGLFLCSPLALYAVNNHVRFEPYATTFELAEVAVGPQHWSRRVRAPS